MADLQAQPWVTGIASSDNVLRIAVNDPVASKRALWPLVSEHGLALARYEWIRPTLEEIFIRLSGGTTP